MYHTRHITAATFLFLLLLGKNIHYMDKKQAIFNENDIPYKELELIGISKKQIWSLDKANITALLSKCRSSNSCYT